MTERGAKHRAGAVTAYSLRSKPVAVKGSKPLSGVLMESATTAVLTVIFGAVLASLYYWLITGAYAAWELQLVSGAFGLLGSGLTVYYFSHNVPDAVEPEEDGARVLGVMLAIFLVALICLLFGVIGAPSMAPSISEVGRTLTQGQYTNLVWAADFVEVAFTAMGTWALGIFLYLLYERLL